ncbi:hypothetical protein Glove_180g93 [Diversispora epigaea]|uniref:Protein-serine/threonine kinase n=1 Tax=Diversispora epigaea TaxID=1348612 RepID=A0A397IXP0_9GLOM|nr:hypothetical protein Glove_180g93 [Diversispora epigaea]
MAEIITNRFVRQANFPRVTRIRQYFPKIFRNSHETISKSLSNGTSKLQTSLHRITTTPNSEPIQFTSLSHNVRTISPNSIVSPPPPPSHTLHSSKSFKSTLQHSAFSSQHFYQNRILDQYVSQSTNQITLRQLIFFGRNLNEERIIKSGNYVRTELTIRIAHRIRDFQNLPFVVGTNPHIAKVYDLYWVAFETLRKFPPIKTIEDNEEFCKTLKGLLNKHLVVIPQLAMGIIECGEYMSEEQVNHFMNVMLRTRISRRVLAEQQISLTENWNDPNYSNGSDGYIGVVSTQCNTKEIIDKCAKMTSNLCRTTYNIEPPNIIIDGVDTTFSYIPDHIEYIIYELLKNSIRGTIEKHEPSLLHSNNNNNNNSESQNSSQKSVTSETSQTSVTSESSKTSEIPVRKPQKPFPPIIVTSCPGPIDICFRISDQGGGIPDKIYPHIWSFLHKNSDKKIGHIFTNFAKVPQMAATVQEYEQFIIPPNLNLGIGLPMSKVYAEYWGGDLTIFSMDGYGTDSYLTITKLGNIKENLV